MSDPTWVQSRWRVLLMALVLCVIGLAERIVWMTMWVSTWLSRTIHRRWDHRTGSRT